MEEAHSMATHPLLPRRPNMVEEVMVIPRTMEDSNTMMGRLKDRRPAIFHKRPQAYMRLRLED
jgi:hypothetical protein